MSMFRNLTKFMSLVGGYLYGTRNYNKIFAYPDALHPQDLYYSMVRMPLVKTVAHIDASHLWKTPPIIKTTNNFYSNLWHEFDKDMKIFNIFRRADIMLSIFPYSVIVVHFDKDTNLSEPLSSDAGDVISFRVYPSDTAKISECYNDPASPKHGDPEVYAISNTPTFSRNFSPTKKKNKDVGLEVKIHESRIIHLCEDTDIDEWRGIPRLYPVYNTLLDIAKLAGSSAETFYNVADRGISISVDKDFGVITDEDLKALKKNAKEIKESGGEKIFVGRGTSVSSIGSDAPDPRGTMQFLFQLLSGIIKYPLRSIFGTEAGELGSSQDRANVARKTESRRYDFAERIVFNQLNRILIAGGVIDAIPDDLVYEWADAFSPSSLEKAEASSKGSRAFANLLNALKPDKNGNYPLTLLTTDEMRERFFDKDPLDPADMFKPPALIPDNKPADSGDGESGDGDSDNDEGKDDG